jgi:sporulation protein YlmC with PRC-barrel domain
LLKLHSQLVGLSLMGLREGREAGRIHDVVIEPDTGRLLAYVVGSGLLQGTRIIAASDVREVSPDLAIIDGADDITTPDEIIKVQSILRDGYRLQGARVVSESGQRRGRVADYAVDVVTHSLERLNVRQTVPPKELIIPRAEIVRIEPRRVVVKEELAPAKLKGAVGVQPAP